MTILLVDDDEDFRHGLAENLRDVGYPALEFSRPAEVPPLTQLGAVHLTITDYLMNGEDGLSFAHRFHSGRPDVPVVILTAYSPEHPWDGLQTHAKEICAARGSTQAYHRNQSGRVSAQRVSR